jgi:hypothetical protein
LATAAAAPDLSSKPSGRLRAPWWAYSAFFMGALGIFIVYSVVIVLFDYHRYFADPYLSPFFSPVLPAGNIAGLIISPGVWVVWSPAAFRVTCYYYRKGYYRGTLTPPACAVSAPDALQRVKYRGEESFPWVLNNFHRFFLYAAAINLAFNGLDAFHSFRQADGHFMIGLGTVIMVVNLVALSAWMFGCHAFRHLIGGNLDCYSCDWRARVRKGLWDRVTYLNERHGLFALTSLFTVWGVDVYVRLLTHGVLRDPRIVF